MIFETDFYQKIFFYLRKNVNQTDFYEIKNMFKNVLVIVK